MSQEDDIDGEHIIAFAEESDPGMGPLGNYMCSAGVSVYLF